MHPFSSITMAGHLKLLLLLLLTLFAFSVSGQVFWSVNCGASDSYIDDNLITWTPDDNLVSNGVARVVQSSNSQYPMLNTLRVFTSRKKNCYSTSVTKGEKLLVRAGFNYGNYDRLSSPPTFDLHFDGNFWTTVETSISIPTAYEATFVAKGNTVSVCVAQTKPNQFPFMSTLEVRSVDSKVYKEVDDSQALFLLSRLSYGASDTLRFPKDPYDRLWVPAGDGFQKVTNKADFIDPTGPNNPPYGIFENAATVESTINNNLFLGRVPPSIPPIYLAMYFSEVSNLDSNQKRSFRVYETSFSKTSPLSSIISPIYGAVKVFTKSNYTVESITDLNLFRTVDSDLPPLINALEAFNISDVLTDGTDSNDVEALALLQNKFDVLAGWSGDPCLPAPYSWDWLDCSNDTPPRVTSLNLDGFDLSGSLPDISSMDALQTIDLHNNSLTGAIPSFLGSMSNLQQLNLADNQLGGPIPTSLSKNNKLKLTVTGNPSLCTSGKSCSSSSGDTIDSSSGSTTFASKKKSNKLPVVLGTTIPTFFLIWVGAGAFIILRKKNKPNKTNMPTGHIGGGANGNSNGLHNIGEEMINEIVDNVVQQTTIGSPSPLLDNSGQTSHLYGVNNP